MAISGTLWMVLAASMGAVIGAALGATRSCESGGCPLTANPVRGALVGALLGITAALAAGVGGGTCPFLGRSTPTPGANGEHPSSLPSLTAETFDSTVASGVVLVDFGAAWCGPCRDQLPILETLAPEAKGFFAIARVDVDAQEGLASRHGISRLPTLIFFRDGQPVKTLVGLHSAKALLEAFAQLPTPAGS